MWEDYVSFETAKLLKEKGFVEECDSFYFYDKTQDEITVRPKPFGLNVNKDDFPNCFNKPTLQMAMKWLREECNIFISIVFCTYPTEKRVTWTPEISTFDSVFPESAIEYDSYEEACEAGIKYCLTNLI